jgi:hypothetical protein
MGSEQIHVVDPSFSLLLKLWLLAVAGLVIPSVVVMYWPDMSWAGKAERAHHRSQVQQRWVDPWRPINQRTFSSGWIRCRSLEDALALDRKLDDGNLHSGKLILSEGGLAWLPN